MDTRATKAEIKRYKYEAENHIKNTRDEIISIRCEKCKRHKLPKEFKCKIMTDENGTRYKHWSHNCTECRAINKENKAKHKHAYLKQLQDEGLRRCCDCGEVKKFDDFSRNRSVVSGRSSICKSCSSIRKKRYKYSAKRSISELKNFYVRKCLLKTRVKPEDITPTMIDEKRIQLMAYREAKNTTINS